jgi:uncharacterized protein (TIGR02646 family)
MKFIPKSLKDEPACLREYRNTENAVYQPISGLNEALIEQQGHICAYCMRRISVDYKRYSESVYIPQVGVEHLLPRESHKDKALDFNNLVAVCNGIFGHRNHCDKTETYDWLGIKKRGKIDGKVILQKLNPTNADCENLIEYNLNGLIKSVHDDEIVEEDLLKLNLNDEKLKSYRKNIIDVVKARLNRTKHGKTGKIFTKTDFEKEIDFWSLRNAENQFQPFCQIAIWYLRLKSAKSIYN